MINNNCKIVDQKNELNELNASKRNDENDFKSTGLLTSTSKNMIFIRNNKNILYLNSFPFKHFFNKGTVE